MPEIETRVAAIFRQDRAIEPEGNTVIEADDEVFFIAAPHHIRAVMGELRQLDKPYKRIIVAGGGNIGTRLAQAFENDFRVKVIERDLTRCRADRRDPGADHRPAGRRRRRKPTAAGEYRGYRRLLRRHQRRRGQHPVGHAGQADGGAQGHGPDQPCGLCGSGAERHHRRRHFAPAGHHRQSAASMCAAAMWSRCIPCGAARPRPSRPSPMATPNSSKVVGRAIEEIKLPTGTTISAPSSAGRRCSWPIMTPSSRPRTMSSCSCGQAPGGRGREAVPGAGDLPVMASGLEPSSRGLAAGGGGAT